MKRFFWIFGISTSLLFPFFSSADNVIGNTGDTPALVKASFAIPDQGMLQYVNLGFCDEELTRVSKQDVINIRPGQTKEICMVFANTSTGDAVDISASFVDAENDVDGKLICSLDTSTGTSLVSLISFNPSDYTFTLAPQEKLLKRAKLTVPKHMTGTVYGCVGYQLDIKKPDNYTGLFFVVRRNVGLMEVHITGDVYNFGRFDNIKYAYKDHQMPILKVIAGILGILLVYYVFMAMKGNKTETKHHTKK